MGAGPAGSACAVSLREAGIDAVILDREHFPRPAPGETLHPGVEPILEKLGILTKVKTAGFVRHTGIDVVHPDGSQFVPYDKNRTWQGFQLYRTNFDSILLDRAIELGADFVPGVALDTVGLRSDGSMYVVRGRGCRWEADYFVDATGSRAWMANRLAIGFKQHSSRRIAYYGYVRPDERLKLPNPKLIWDATGWTWLAEVRRRSIAWVRLDLRPGEKRAAGWVPEQVEGCESLAPRKAADVSWRMAKQVSAANYFLAGDAAFRLDPASSHGVLKAIMSGMMIAHLIQHNARLGRNGMHQSYQQWLGKWFEADSSELRRLYASNLPTSIDGGTLEAPGTQHPFAGGLRGPRS